MQAFQLQHSWYGNDVIPPSIGRRFGDRFFVQVWKMTNFIEIDIFGNIFITGYTFSPNLPVQDSGTYFNGVFSGPARDIMILKFDNTGNRLWATYYGGSGTEDGYAMDTDKDGNVLITGRTSSANFEVQAFGGALKNSTVIPYCDIPSFPGNNNKHFIFQNFCLLESALSSKENSKVFSLKCCQYFVCVSIC